MSNNVLPDPLPVDIVSPDPLPVSISSPDPINTNPRGDFWLNVQEGDIAGHFPVLKYGRNPDIDTASGFEALWNGGGLYTGQDPIVAETLETFSSSATDSGTLISSGTATGGSLITLDDSGADFVADGVAVGDVVINDSLVDHGIVTSVATASLGVARMDSGAINVLGNAYRVATQASTGASVVKLEFLLDGSLDNQTSEYIILNGATAVDTVGTYKRHSRGIALGGDNAGSITTRQKTTTANITMVMPIGYNATMIAAYTVPKGKKAFILNWFAALAKKQAGFSNIRLLIRSVNCQFQVKEEFTISTTGSSYVERLYKIPKDSINEMSDIVIVADTSINDMGVAGGFDLIVEDI